MNWNYLFKHWFGTLALGPIIAQVVAYYSLDKSHAFFGFFEYYPLYLFFGLFFSTPTYVLYGFLYHFLAMKNFPYRYAKPILISISVLGVFTTFWLIGGSMSFNGAISYSISSILTGLFFKLNFKKDI